MTITGKDVDIKLIPKRMYLAKYREYVKGFSESASKAQEVTVPAGTRAWAMYEGLNRNINRLGLKGKIRVKVVKCKQVYIYKT